MLVKQFKNRERQMREYAKVLVHVADELNDENKQNNLNHESVKEEYNALVNEIVMHGYNINTLLIYMVEYRKMSIEDYMRIYHREV